MTALRLAPDFAIPIDAVTETFWWVGKRGSGKSYSCSVFVEELLKANAQVVILDPMHAWWGLRSSADGRHAGLPVAIFGGPRGDVPLEPGAGAYMADLTVSERISMIFDVKGWSKADRRRFVTDYLERLLVRNSEAMHLVLEEAPLFAPQRVRPDETRMLGACEEIVRLGRGSGIGTSLISQRAATLNNEVRSQTEVLVAFRSPAPHDRKAIKDWFDVHDADRITEAMAELPRLPTGTGLVSSTDFLDTFRKVAFRKRETFDSSATPKVGQVVREARTLADVDLGAIEAAMAATIERALADDPKALRQRIRQLEADLTARPSAAPVEVKIEVPVDVPVFDEALVLRLEEALSPAAAVLAEIQERLTWETKISDDLIHMRRVLRDDRPGLPRARSAGDGARAGVVQEGRRAPKRADPPVRRDPGGAPVPGAATSGKPKQRVLDAIAWLNAVGFAQPTKLQAGFVAGYRVGKKVGGTFGNLLGELRSAGLIEYPNPGSVALTDAGRAEAGMADFARTDEGLQGAILARLTEPERRVLRVLLDAYPGDLSKQETGERSGYQVGAKVGGTFGNLLGHLRSLGLVEYPKPGRVTACPVLFIR